VLTGRLYVMTISWTSHRRWANSPSTVPENDSSVTRSFDVARQLSFLRHHLYTVPSAGGQLSHPELGPRFGPNELLLRHLLRDKITKFLTFGTQRNRRNWLLLSTNRKASLSSLSSFCSWDSVFAVMMWSSTMNSDFLGVGLLVAALTLVRAAPRMEHFYDAEYEDYYPTTCSTPVRRQWHVTCQVPGYRGSTSRLLLHHWELLPEHQKVL